MGIRKLVINVRYEKPIKLNQKGTIVKAASMLLEHHGSTLKATDVFNIGMRSAVVAFQKRNKIKPTGVINKKTWEKLLKAPGVEVKA